MTAWDQIGLAGSSFDGHFTMGPDGPLLAELRLATSDDLLALTLVPLRANESLPVQHPSLAMLGIGALTPAT